MGKIRRAHVSRKRRTGLEGGKKKGSDDEEEDDDMDGDLQRSVFTWLPTEELSKPSAGISAHEVAANFGVPYKHLASYLKGEIAEAEACRSLPFTLFLVISYSIMAVAHDDAITIRAVEDSLEFDIMENANFAFTGEYMGHKALEDIHAVEDIYEWMTDGLIPLVMQQETAFHEGYLESDPRYQTAKKTVPPEDRGFWLNYNRIVGGMRLVQEVTPERGCETQASLLPMYGLQCVGGHDYDLDPEMGLPSERASTTINPVRERWLWVIDDISDVLQQVAELDEEGWINRETMKVEIGIPIYNAEFGVHTLVRINFYFSRGGHIWKKILPMSQFADWHDRWYYGMYDGFWMICIIIIFVMEVNEVQALVRSKGTMAIFTEYISFYNAVDWLTVLGGFAILAVFATSIGMRTEMNTLLQIIAGTDIYSDRPTYNELVRTYFMSLQDNVNYVRNLRRTLAVYPLIIVFRLFKSFSAQPRLALVTRTMFRAGPDLFHFSLVFMSVFMTFTICGIVLFGREVRSFTTVSRAMVSCFRIMLGDIEWEELSAVGRLPAGIWLWLFVIIVVLLMLNMVLAIVMDNYEEVKAEAGSGETLWQEALQLWERWRDKDYVPLDHVLDAVRAEEKRHRLAARAGGSVVNRLFASLVKGVESNKHGEAERQQADGPSSPKATVQIEADQKETKAPVQKTSSYKSWASEQMHNHGNEGYLLIVTVDLMVDSIQKLPSMQAKPSANQENRLRKQALNILKDAVQDFHEHNKRRAELDELVQLTLKVSSRVKNLTKLTRQAHEVRDEEPVKELRWFQQDLDKYIADVNKEQEENIKERDLLRHQHQLLKERLLHFDPGYVFPPVPAGAPTISAREQSGSKRSVDPPEAEAEAEAEAEDSSTAIAPSRRGAVDDSLDRGAGVGLSRSELTVTI